MTITLRKTAIPYLYIIFWTRNSEFPQRHFLCSLTQPEITRQRDLELTDIEYDQIKDEISMMERVE